VTSPFLSAVVDTLLPGDQGSPPLPTGTAAGVATKLAQVIAGPDRAVPDAVLQAIAREARGEDAFVRADAAGRIAVVRQVEAGMPGPFQALVALVLQDYYEADVVLLAMGWRVQPPQPQGHTLPPFDETLLAPVKERGRMWR
jgi:gluconate 2-dehydrogenase subunit 3-like protein